MIATARVAIALIAIAATGSMAAADDAETAADQAFRAAETAVANGSAAAALDQFEALGAARPTTRWTDDAWLEAARLAERGRDYDRARRDLEAVIAVTTDDQLARRAKNALVRIATAAGSEGQWSAVAAEHERLANAILAPTGDPKPAIVELERLVRDHPDYPHAGNARLVIARGRERDGDADDAIATLRAAASTGPAIDRRRAGLELVRVLVRHDDLDEATIALARVDHVDPHDRAEVADQLDTARRREWWRRALWLGLAALGAAAAIWLRRTTGSWRATGRALLRPPIELAFFVPIAIVIVIVAATGNPMVARAVRTIAIAGAAVAWISGVALEARRQRGPLSRLGAAGHAACAALAVAAAVWLAIDRDHMIDLVEMTWRDGPAMR